MNFLEIKAYSGIIFILKIISYIPFSHFHMALDCAQDFYRVQGRLRKNSTNTDRTRGGPRVDSMISQGLLCISVWSKWYPGVLAARSNSRG
jgi:hypothetical protein